MKTPRELSQMVRRWQKLLGLSHWTIAIRVADEEVSSDGNTAEVARTPENRFAAIIFFQSAFDEDIQDTVIHELLHIHFSSLRLEVGTPAGDVEEHAVCAISRCISKLAGELE